MKSTVIRYLYHTLCFVGLVLQLTVISINYFQFESVSSVEIELPGNEESKAINVCFLGHELHNFTRYRERFFYHNQKYNEHWWMGKQWRLYSNNKTWNEPSWDWEYRFYDSLTISDRFYVSIPLNRVFKMDAFHSDYTLDGRMFIYNEYVCYQVYSRVKYDNTVITRFSWEPELEKWKFPYKDRYLPYEYIFYLEPKMGFKTNNSDDIKQIHVLLSSVGKLPWFEFFTTPRQIIFQDYRHIYNLSANSYKFSLLGWPYSDNCLDYSRLGFIDRDDAVNSCINDKVIANHSQVYHMKLFTEGLNYSSDSQNKVFKKKDYRVECFMKYKNKDCFYGTQFTKIATLNTPSKYLNSAKYAIGPNAISHNTSLYFNVDVSREPSFKSRSQAKQSLVDYMCFTLAAFGSWFGFIVLMLNLVPYLLSYFRKKQISPASKEDDKCSLMMLQMSALSYKIESLEQIIRQMNRKTSM